MNDTEKQKIKDDYFEWHYEMRDDVVPTDIVYYWLSILDKTIKSKLEAVEELKNIHEMELDAISLKSLEDFIIWSDNRKLNKHK